MMEQFTTQGVSSVFVGELQQDIDSLKGVKEGMIQLLYISPSPCCKVCTSPHTYMYHTVYVSTEIIGSDTFRLDTP